MQESDDFQADTLPVVDGNGVFIIFTHLILQELVSKDRKPKFGLAQNSNQVHA